MIPFLENVEPTIPVNLQATSPAEGVCESTPVTDVGQIRLGCVVSLRELQAHAAHCHLLMQLAKARCRPEIHSAQDEEDLRTWSKAKDEAQAALLAAEVEQRITEGVDYFQSPAARAQGGRHVG